jgi:hypothetical protein
METERRYTITELADASAAALDALGIAARNGQVRDRPDTRTIRYYSALGLVDPPAEMTGRTARYGDRHLLQVLAVKAMQARGASLADVQRALVGASEAELRRAVGPGLPAALAGAPAATMPADGHDAPAPRDHPFWRTPPSPPPAESPAAAPALDAGDPAMQVRPLVAVPLAAGATLVIEHAGSGGTDTDDWLDLEALRTAAAPLLAYLTRAGLVPGSPNHEGTTR